MRKVQIRCKMERQKLTLIACSLPVSCQGLSPLSHVFFTTIEAWHATPFCFTSVESGVQSGGSRAGKEASQDLNRIHFLPPTPRCHWSEVGKGSSYWEGEATTCVSHFKNYHLGKKVQWEVGHGTYTSLHKHLNNHLPEYILSKAVLNQVKSLAEILTIQAQSLSKKRHIIKSINKHSLNVHSVPSTTPRFLRPKEDRG